MQEALQALLETLVAIHASIDHVAVAISALVIVIAVKRK